MLEATNRQTEKVSLLGVPLASPLPSGQKAKIKRSSYDAAVNKEGEGEEEEQSSRGVGWMTQEGALLALAVVGLMFSTVLERVTFKVVVDRMTPFRLVLTQTVLVTSVLVYGTIALGKRGLTTQVTAQMHQFPHSKLVLMALLDTLQFSCLVASAAGVTPTMTVILLHASTPVVVLGSRLLFSDRVYTDLQLRGVTLVASAVMIGFMGQVWLLLSRGSVQLSGTLSSFFYVLAAALQGAASLYKEKAIIDWKQPIDVHSLSTWLFFYQTICVVVLMPAIYMLQGVSSNWYGFPLNSLTINLRDGWTCLWGQNTFYSQGDDAGTRLREEPYDSKYEDCEYSFVLIVAYVISNVLVLGCIDRVLQTSMQAMGRATAGAVLLAFLALAMYDMQVDKGDQIFGGTVGVPDLVSIVVLLAGLEMYARDPEPGVKLVVGQGP